MDYSRGYGRSEDKKSQQSSSSKTGYAKQASKTAVWILVLFWPPIVLLILALLSALVNHAAAPPPPASSVDSIMAAESAIPVTSNWKGLINFLLNIGFFLAIVGAILNFVAGLVLFTRKVARRADLAEHYFWLLLEFISIPTPACDCISGQATRFFASQGSIGYLLAQENDCLTPERQSRKTKGVLK